MLNLIAASVSINFDLWNFIIAVVALLLAIYGIWITKSGSQCRIEIDKYSLSKKVGEPYLIEFSVHNVSVVATKICRFEFFDLSNKAISPRVSYNPKQQMTGTGVFTMPIPTMPFEEESILANEEVLQPHSEIVYRYFFDKVSSPMNIKITCDKRITWFHQSKSFSVAFRNFK